MLCRVITTFATNNKLSKHGALGKNIFIYKMEILKSHGTVLNTLAIYFYLKKIIDTFFFMMDIFIDVIILKMIAKF